MPCIWQCSVWIVPLRMWVLVKARFAGTNCFCINYSFFSSHPTQNPLCWILSKLSKLSSIFPTIIPFLGVVVVVVLFLPFGRGEDICIEAQGHLHVSSLADPTLLVDRVFLWILSLLFQPSVSAFPALQDHRGVLPCVCFYASVGNLYSGFRSKHFTHWSNTKFPFFLFLFSPLLSFHFTFKTFLF